jgi:hypothetical protein
MSQIPIKAELQLQSPYLYCQAAGSTEADDSKGGVHVRWDLMKELGYNHIPKGNLAGSSVGFNKSEDFVSLYRANFPGRADIEIIFDQTDREYVTYLPGSAGIIYRDPNSRLNIIVRFSDRGGFQRIIDRGLDPSDPIQDFLNSYRGIIEVEVEGRLMMKYSFNMQSHAGTGEAVFETVSAKDRLDPQALHVIKRERKDANQLRTDGIDTTGENIKYFRIEQFGMPAPQVMTIHTYEHIFNTLQDGDAWEFLGDFSLSLDDNQVFTWFQGEPYGGGTPSLRWPKYNDGVHVEPVNYLDRWSHGSDNLRDTIAQYIQLSDTDPRAMINLPSEDPGDTNAMTVSMLDMLKLVGLDYHGARMMGLGYLDGAAFHNDLPMIYAAAYRTEPPLPRIGGGAVHVFMTLPTSINDWRLPVAPNLGEVTYGLYVSTDENSAPELISDPNGYSFLDNVRFINLNKENVNAPQPLKPTVGKGSFDATQITQPVSFGIEYGTPDDFWRAPELLHDEFYRGTDGQWETITTPETENNPIYTHRETNQGIHIYALYSVNWFSRVSGLSNIAQTDNTVFVKRNTLMPPLNFSVQYIQEEDPLIFTTQAEQAALTAANVANPNGDNYKTRASFDWNNLHNNAYQAANKIEFFFRDTPIKKIEGLITGVTSISDTECQVQTGPFTMYSVTPPMVISPAITMAEQSLFAGSVLNTPEGQFQVISVQASTPGPVFTVKKLVATQTVQATPDDPVITIPVYTEPKTNAIFYVFENVSLTNQWAKLNRTVNIYNFSNTTEIIEEEDGSTHVEFIGGINGAATIQEIPDPVNPLVMTGGYTVTFNAGVNLPAHPEPSVSWVKGSARFFLNNAPGRKKVLPVVAIQQSAPIRLVVFDPDYLASPNDRIRTGSNVLVNFHPGYRVYLSPEPGIFDKTKTMPAATANNKKTYLAARSADTTIPLYSTLTQPAILVARNMQKPLAPEAAVGPLFATRPDFYGKSTYTLDIALNITNRTPFGVVVYRSSDMSILQTLYKPETLQQVIADLAAIEGNDPLRFNRWRSLVEVETDPGNNNAFRLFGTYRFPNPDNNSTIIFPTSAGTSIRPFPLQAGETIQSKKAMIKKAIEDIFTPLTETPVVFEYLKVGYQTSSEQPRTRSIIGRILSPSDPAFNPFPMAVKFPSPTPNTVRFTDYTLSGNSRNIYFYFAREIGIDTRVSERTPVSGPVVLVDAAPAEKPKIRKIVTQEQDPGLNRPAAVVFDLAEYITSERIRQYQVFRTTDFSSAATVRTMQLASTVDVGDLVQDVFTDLPFPPFGQSLFYRVVALREIVNEQGQTEMIPSQPSEMVLANIIDVVNPQSPVITAQIGSQQTNGTGQLIALLNVTLRWPQTVYNGTYYLYKMNSRGNWEKLWSKKTNAALIEFPENGDFVTWPQTANLPKVDEEGNTVYHRFKVSVENASGLFNQEDKELVI